MLLCGAVVVWNPNPNPTVLTINSPAPAEWTEGRNRIRLSSACVLDVLQYAEGQMSPAAISHYQQEDLLALGPVLSLLRSRSLVVFQLP